MKCILHLIAIVAAVCLCFTPIGTVAIMCIAIFKLPKGVETNEICTSSSTES